MSRIPLDSPLVVLIILCAIDCGFWTLELPSNNVYKSNNSSLTYPSTAVHEQDT